MYAHEDKMVTDPYKALELPHDATQAQIKRSYRRLAMKYHPDRLQSINASKEEIESASAKFATCAQAYALLTDERRKRQYDHIYKFGGYDDPPENSCNEKENSNPNKNSVPRMGVGYCVSDPFTYIMSQGKIRSKAVAGVTIPSRFHMAHSPGGGFRVSFSSGKLEETPSGTIECISKTTQFAQGKRFSKVETTTLHNDGRKVVVIEGDDYVERRFSKAPIRKRRTSKDGKGLTHTGDELPWYMSAWNGIRDNLPSCSNPCGAISVK